MAVAECALEKKLYCFGVKYEHVFKMRKYLGVGEKVSVGAMIEMICDKLFADIRLTAKERKRIAEIIEENRQRRAELRSKWPQMERRKKDTAWRKARYKAKMAAKKESVSNASVKSRKGGAK